MRDASRCSHQCSFFTSVFSHRWCIVACCCHGNQFTWYPRVWLGTNEECSCHISNQGPSCCADSFFTAVILFGEVCFTLQSYKLEQCTALFFLPSNDSIPNQPIHLPKSSWGTNIKTSGISKFQHSIFVAFWVRFTDQLDKEWPWRSIRMVT